MHGKVNDDEWEIFRDAFRLYAAHCDPPENQAQDAEEWWLSMVKDTSEKAAKWNNHPLMMLLFRAVTNKGISGGGAGMNQRRNCSHYVYGEKEPWKAFASAVIVQAVKDFRSCGRMQYELRQKFRSETKLTAEERDYLTYRIMQYKQRLDELRIFFQSGRFVLLTDIDGIQLLKRLEREIA